MDINIGKFIQPITDRICERHGLPPLEFDAEIRKGKSYAQWEADQKGKPNWKKIIRADIDYIISISENETEFFHNMEKIGYQIRKGESQKHGVYLAFKAMEQKRAWRSYNLGNGYSYSEILSRIKTEKFVCKYPTSPKLRFYRIGKNVKYIPMLEFQKKRIRKIYFVSVGCHNLKNPYAVDYQQVRKSMLHINQLWEDVTYLRQEKIQTYEELLCRETEIKEQEKALKNQKYSTDFLQENEVYLKYRSLKERLKEIPESEDEFEKVLDELEELEQNLPDAVLNGKTFNEQEQIEQKLQILREEKRIIRHIKREETEDQFFSTPLQPIERSKDKKKEVQEQWVKAR